MRSIYVACVGLVTSLLCGVGCSASTTQAPLREFGAGTGGATLPATGGTGGAAGSQSMRAPATPPPVMSPVPMMPPMMPAPMAPAPMAPAGGAPGAPAPVATKEPRLPEVDGECPQLATGMVQIKGRQVQLWVGQKQAEKKAPIMFYWHGTGAPSSMAQSDLGPALDEIVGEGGLVASFTDTTAMGMNTGNNVWYTGDFELADQILACAIKQLNIDTHRIYTGGCSAGGLQASVMVYQRSSYLAAAMPNSGGTIMQLQSLYMFDDPDHIPALITTHGAPGQDVVIIDFSVTSAYQTKDIAAKGGFAVNCNHGGMHCGSPAAVKAAQWQFLKDHPFGVTPEPYAAGLPAGFPDVCEIVK